MNVIPLHPEPESDPVEILFCYWQTVMEYKRARLDSKRRKIITERLRDGYTLDDLKDAVSGCYLSPWHHEGDNDRMRRYDDISLICRDAEHVDSFINTFEVAAEKMARVEAIKEAPKDQISDPATAKLHLDKMRRMLRR